MPNNQSLIINSPYKAPAHHWRVAETGGPLALEEGRRPAGYMISDPGAAAHRDVGRFVALEEVNKIRKRVDAWRAAGYPGVTGITNTLLAHWRNDEARETPFFFCQMEAMETLIWLVESDEAARIGINILGDGGKFLRLCSKLATGTGKTVVMAMLIAWQTINRATYPSDARFSKNILVVAPNLTVRERLGVLTPAHADYYEEFGVAPISMRVKLRQATVRICNWHALNWDDETKIRRKKGVDKRGAKSDERYARDVLGDAAHAKNWIVINDEAHHAWRVPADKKERRETRRQLRDEQLPDAIEEATKWVGGLDRIHRARGILRCFDFSATPFAPSGRAIVEESLFGWIVSDFGLNDAIESGIVKTPRVVVRDDALPDAATYKSRLYHLFNDAEINEDLKRTTAKPDERLPDFLRGAYVLLGADWEKVRDSWRRRAQQNNAEQNLDDTPPVMISVVNQTATAARIKYEFDKRKLTRNDLCEADGILHIDTEVLKKAEQNGEADSNAAAQRAVGKPSKKREAERLREKVNTVGKFGKPGAAVQNVISVGMLSEGWDARTVTHIMGLRAFTSQLLCEQVVGRGLRRASYEINPDSGLFDAEYVNVFGVPFSFTPHVGDDGVPPPSPPKVTVESRDENDSFEITWPNVIRVDHALASKLHIDWQRVKPLQLDAAATPRIAEIAPTVAGQADIGKVSRLDCENWMKKNRLQTIAFEAAKEVWDAQQSEWSGSRFALFAQLAELAEKFLTGDRIDITPQLLNHDAVVRRTIITLNMKKTLNHFWRAITAENTKRLTPVLDEDYPICSTADMRPWRTGKPIVPTKKSHINCCVCDSTWEAKAAHDLDNNKWVAAWAKNDHLNFEVPYVHAGVVRKYRPDFLIRLSGGDMLVLEVKGQQTDADESKQQYMREWIEAVNQHGRWGRWRFETAQQASAMPDIIANAVRAGMN